MVSHRDAPADVDLLQNSLSQTSQIQNMPKKVRRSIVFEDLTPFTPHHFVARTDIKPHRNAIKHQQVS
jgi:hypothetical protein